MSGKRILMVLTSHDKLGNTGKQTGWYLPEAAHPHEVFTKAGFNLTYASIKGGAAPLDEGSVAASKDDGTCQKFLKESLKLTQETIPLAKVKADDYDAVFYVGGFGTMWDFPDCKESIELIKNMYEADKIVAAVCHGPVAFVNVLLSDGTPLLKGKACTGFTNGEEDAVQCRSIVPYTCEDKMGEVGGKFVDGGVFKENVQITGNLFTGQNPPSASALAEAIVKALNTIMSAADDSAGQPAVDGAESKEEEVWPTIGVFEGVEDIDPADTPAIIARMPAMFLAAEKGNKEKAEKRWLATIAWRREFDMKNILRRPHPKFWTIKKHFPHWFHFSSKEAMTIYVERSSKIDLKALKEEGVTQEDLLYHYRFITEFIWVYIDKRLPPKGRGVTLLDIQGMGMRDVGGEVLDFIKKASKFTGDHYPERCGHIFILNAPWYFKTIWTMCKTFVDPVTVAKTHICKSGDVKKELLKQIDPDVLPTLYGGECTTELGDSTEENNLKKLVNKLNAGIKDIKDQESK